MEEELLRLDLARAWLAEGTGRGVKIAVIDCGVNPSHPAVAGLKLIDDIAIVEKGASLEVVPGEGKDFYGHGTALTSIIRRLAPEAEIGSIRVLGERLKSRTAIIQEGARQALDRGYHILNCSFGCGIEEHLLRYKAWVDEAYLKNTHIVSACNNNDYQKPEWPGHFPSVLTANFCHTEDPLQFFFRPGHLVEFVANGEEVEVPWLDGSVKKVTGSSYAAAHLTGLLARILSRRPGLGPLEAKLVMQKLAARWPENPDDPNEPTD
jgi:subtilisin family serine protease